MPWEVGMRELKLTEIGIKINCKVAPNVLDLIN